jgi:demethylmenaquinone methyltransferase/2-methoxy-6-polyprenyl-1,4-benzoquinol methylase
MMTHAKDLPLATRPRNTVGAPHQPLPGYPREGESREQFIRQLFNHTAASYDQLNTAFSLGTGQHYRHRTLVAAGLKAGDRILDVAVGTGLVAREACAITGHPGNVVGLDVSEGMLAQARRHLAIPVVQARAEAIPLADSTMDFVSMGYALRHVADLEGVFGEFLRVLKPGGRLVVMEIACPEKRLARGALKMYLGAIVPLLSRVLGSSHDQKLMQYYWDTIEACVPPHAILSALDEVAFINVSCRTELGVFRAYMAQRSPADATAALPAT